MRIIVIIILKRITFVTWSIKYITKIEGYRPETLFKIKNKIIFCLVGRKYHFRSRRPIANVVFSASLDKKIVY